VNAQFIWVLRYVCRLRVKDFVAQYILEVIFEVLLICLVYCKSGSGLRRIPWYDCVSAFVLYAAWFRLKHTFDRYFCL
jgi:hypothetical protein